MLLPLPAGWNPSGVIAGFLRFLEKPPVFRDLARAGAAFPVSAAGDGGLRGQNATRSLARANPFPAEFTPTDRDAFACRLRPVRIQAGGRRREGRRSITANLGQESI